MSLDEMTGLAHFVLARIAEDEAECRREIADGYGGDQHESGWSSNRVLAQLKTNRRIVEAELAQLLGNPNGYVSRDVYERIRARAESDVLRALALPYADHSGYREEWRI